METVHLLAAHVLAARERVLSADAREAACRRVLDLLAGAAAGIDAPGPRAVRRAAVATFAAGRQTVWFSGCRTGLPGAIWCNAAAAAALDLDDGHRLARGHPGAAVIPAAFAAAEAERATTAELLVAITVGYEVAVAVGAARRFYANSGLWSGYGAVAALGFLRRTPAEQLAQAFAIAGVSAPNQLHAGAGPAYPAQEGSDVKEGIPWSDVTAVTALLLAESGHAGPLALLDSGEHFHPGRIADGLARQDAVGRSYVKFHAACRHVHAPVEALLGLLARHHLDPRAIEAVDVETYSGALRIANRTRPIGFTDIQFSIPYCLGLVALDGPQALLPLMPQALGRAEITAFAEKVSLRLAPDLERCFPAQTLARVTVLSGGRSFVSAQTSPRGEADDPPSWEELEGRLRAATRLVATPAQQQRLLTALRQLCAGDHGPLLAALARIRLSRPREEAA